MNLKSLESNKFITKSCTRTHIATRIFVYFAALHCHTKTLSAICAGELGVGLFKKRPMTTDSPPPCWICGAPSDSREHVIKRSDLSRRYGKLPFDQTGGMLHVKGKISRRIQSSNSKSLKYPLIICSECNNERSQPWDKAYEKFEKWLFHNSALIFKQRFVDLEEVYGAEVSFSCPNLYKYFVKAFGCRLADSGMSVPPDLVNLLFQDYFLTKLRLCFSIHKTMFVMYPNDRDNFLGVGDLIRIDSISEGVMERYKWCMNIGWLRIWHFYDLAPPPRIGAPWTSDSSCLYLGESESATLDELIKDAQRNKAPILDRLLEIEQSGGLEIC